MPRMLTIISQTLSGFPWISRAPVVPVVRLSGVIAAGGGLRASLSLAGVAEPLEAAFSHPRARAVALLINSPGGSPVQSTLILKRIRALAEEKSLPVFAFVEDVAASGGYMLACAADEIYADASSIVGSIGVISAGFGAHKLLDKVGLERRVYTAGEKKMMLDPFQPENEDDVARLKQIQIDVHKAFKDLVRTARDGRLREDEAKLFTGEFWAGEQARDLGLIDGLGDIRSVLRKRFGSKVKLPIIGGKQPFWRRMTPLSRAPGIGGVEGVEARWTRDLAEDLIGGLEARAHWSRFGL